ncbi:hypothetical protein NHH73_21980 [Oxalobacteraceae bacterium OTU3CINTB1]|nr:hypothetical protein NHH73_21980 [Oxalobacteraceae bacterium OTU3CINTB1]
MNLLDDITEKLDEWEEAAKAALGISGVTKDHQIDIKDYIREHHEQEIKEDIDRLAAFQATVESRLDDEHISPDGREEVEHILKKIEELIERLKDLL